MAGNDVLMVSGTDEHGTPILVQSEHEGVNPQDLADRYNRVIVEDLTALGLTYDLFTRTTTGNHYRVAQEMFKALHKNGYMIAQTTRGAISPSTGRTLPDRYIEGTCPICGSDGARGDQCDNCGNQFDAVDLENPHSGSTARRPSSSRPSTSSLTFRLFPTQLATWLESRQGWRPNVLNFSLNLLDDVRPRAMTRDIDWGIPVPLPGWEENPNKRLYVWFDAVIGYLSASIEWARRSGDPEAWRKWWNDPETLSYYFMGKDNITFHSQIWPGELLAANGQGSKGGEMSAFGDLQLPTEVVSSEFLTMESSQVLVFSRSRHLRPRHAEPVPAGCPEVLHRRGGPGDLGLPTSRGRSSSGGRTTNSLRRGGTSSTGRSRLLHKNLGSLPALGELAADRPRRPRGVASGVRHGRGAHPSAPPAASDLRGHAGGVGCQQVPG